MSIGCRVVALTSENIWEHERNMVMQALRALSIAMMAFEERKPDPWTQWYAIKALFEANEQRLDPDLMYTWVVGVLDKAPRLLRFLEYANSLCDEDMRCFVTVVNRKNSSTLFSARTVEDGRDS